MGGGRGEKIQREVAVARSTWAASVINNNDQIPKQGKAGYGQGRQERGRVVLLGLLEIKSAGTGDCTTNGISHRRMRQLRFNSAGAGVFARLARARSASCCFLLLSRVSFEQYGRACRVKRRTRLTD